jgi:hypothetical protein
MGRVDVSPIVLGLDSDYPLIDLVVAADLAAADESTATIAPVEFGRIVRNSPSKRGSFV